MTTLLRGPVPADRAAGAPHSGRAGAVVGLVAVPGSALLAGRTTAVLLGVAVLAVIVVANNVARVPRLDPCQLALSTNITIFVSFPFARLPPDRLTSYVVVLAVVAVGASGLLRTAGRPAYGQGLLLAFFGIYTVSSAVSPDPGAVKVVAVTATAAALTFLLASRLAADRVVPVARTVVGLAVTEGLLAIVEPVLFPRHLWAPAQVGPSGRVVPLLNSLLPGGIERSQGTMGHPLQLALLLLLALALLLRVLPVRSAGWAVCTGALLLAGLVASGSRSALLGALVLLLVGRRSSGLDRLLSCWVALLVALGLVTRRILSTAPLTSLLGSGSYVHRASAYDSFPKLIFEQPAARVFFGNGIASTTRVFTLGLLQTDGFNVVDNQFVLTLSQGGVLCLALLVAIAGTALVRAGPALRPAVLVVVAAMLILDSVISPASAALTFLAIGLACRRDPGTVT